ncbi:hypothetical protein GEMRC1_012458 [Eukaryota sp. GEM-RC1]
MSLVQEEFHQPFEATVVTNTPSQQSAFTLALNHRFAQPSTSSKCLHKFKHRTINRIHKYLIDNPPLVEEPEPVKPKPIPIPVTIEAPKPRKTAPSKSSSRPQKPVPASLLSSISSADANPPAPEPKPVLPPEVRQQRAQERYLVARQRMKEDTDTLLSELKATVSSDVVCSCPGSLPFDESGKNCADNCPLKVRSVRVDVIREIENNLLETYRANRES